MKKILSIASAVLVSLSSLNAALVWDTDRGWTIEGGVLANVFGESVNVDNALQAMNEARKSQENGDYWTALGYYKVVTKEYPESIFAPEAYFQMNKCYVERGQYEEAYLCLGEIIKRYPDYQNFNQVIGEQFKIASQLQNGATPWLWGLVPWIASTTDIIKYYEGVVKNAPYSDYAPIALMNISFVAEDGDKPEIAEDALDRLINNYPNSLFTPDAYLQMAKIYNNLVQGAEYDQFSTKKAIAFYQDYLILFPQEAGISNAEKSLDNMRDTYARSRLVMGDFYYYYRTDNKAASIFYNEAITLAPDSPAATEARKQLAKIDKGQIGPMTPVDWFWGRYEKPETDVFDEGDIAMKTQMSKYLPITLSTFMSAPGALAEVQATEGSDKFMPVSAEVSDDLHDEYFWKPKTN